MTVKGDNITLTTTTLQDGGVFFEPIRADMLRTPHTEPQVHVIINTIPSACVGNCSFEWRNESTPTIMDMIYPTYCMYM